MDLFNDKEMELLRIAGVSIENRENYSDEDKRFIFRQVTEFIMNHSSKNGDIGRLQNEYDEVINKIDVD